MYLGIIFLGVYYDGTVAGGIGALIFILLEYLLQRIMKREEDKTIIYQNKLMKQQMDEIENIYMTMRGWRHDYHNHLQSDHFTSVISVVAVEFHLVKKCS